MEWFAANVKKLARDHGGQVPLGEAIGVNQSTISKWGKGGAIKEMGPVKRLAELAGVSVEDLLDRNLEEIAPRAPAGGAMLLLPVALPNEATLTDMFLGMFASAGRSDLEVEFAAQLAQRLPAALKRSLDRRPDQGMGEETALGGGARPRAKDRPAHQ
jgi:hypothetical protein